ncbi:MAG: T9SS type B sorting domain-containing protein [Chitinophagales bacterium]
MKRIFSLLVLWASVHVISAQSIRGIINNQTDVSAINYCNNSVTVGNPAIFSVNQKVLIIQMEGAVVNTGNTTSYGNIITYGNSGNFEMLSIRSIVGNVITFETEIVRTYDAGGLVQLVAVPEYGTAIVDSNLTVKPWDGASGGVLVLKADTLILNDTIDISGCGFRGFFGNDSLQSAEPNGNPSGFYYTSLIWGAPKGEAIAALPHPYGQGKVANGGGGGNNENSGGGGGGNYGGGGRGGESVNNVLSAQGHFPGIGGLGLTYNNSANKIFMGGGGGCGHGNNWSAAYGFDNTGGKNGGGICILIVNTLIGNNQAIRSRGLDQTRMAHGDGAGAGGAGGTVLLQVNQYNGNLTVDLGGGKGGNVDNALINNQKCWGPGGGGGGGALLYSQGSLPANINFTATGGANGFITFGNSGCGVGSTGGAAPGQAGGSLGGVTITQGTTTYQKLTATFSNDTTICSGRPVSLKVQATSSDTLSYQWSSGSINPNINVAPAGTTVYNVTVADGNSCSVTKQINVIVQNIVPDFSNDTSLCGSATVTLHATNTTATAANYLWSNGAITPTISITPAKDTAYSVTVSGTGAAACSVSKTIHVRVGSLNVNFSNDTAVCRGKSVTLFALPANPANYIYRWNTGDSLSTITILPNKTKTYVVSVTDTASGCHVTKNILVEIDTILIAVTPDTVICPGTAANLQVSLIGSGIATYQWSSGGTGAIETVTPTSSTAYFVTATSDKSCTSSKVIKVFLDTFNTQLTISNDTIICPGSKATLSASAVGSVSFKWSEGSSTQQIQPGPSSNTFYRVTATNAIGCMVSDSVKVSVNDTATHLHPVISATPGFSVELGQSLQLSVSPATAAGYQWLPGSFLSDSSVFNPTCTPQQPQQQYCVTVTDVNFCKATVCEMVMAIVPEPKIAMPTAFTPNGDGRNDIYKIVLSGPAVVDEVKIFNRWGELVYQANDNFGWDGKTNGVEQPSENYSVSLRYFNTSDPSKKYYKIQQITLFR